MQIATWFYITTNLSKSLKLSSPIKAIYRRITSILFKVYLFIITIWKIFCITFVQNCLFFSLFFNVTIVTYPATIVRATTQNTCPIQPLYMQMGKTHVQSSYCICNRATHMSNLAIQWQSSPTKLVKTVNQRRSFFIF